MFDQQPSRFYLFLIIQYWLRKQADSGLILNTLTREKVLLVNIFKYFSIQPSVLCFKGILGAISFNC